MSNFTKLKLCHTLGISQSTHFWVKGALTALLLVLCGNVAKAQSDLTFNEGIRYSKWVIDSRMNEFYANTTKCGFAVYDQNGKQTAGRVDGKTSLDYVVGLVAKSIIEASQFYSQFTWAQSFAKPWFLSIQNYGDSFYSKFRTVGGSLDDLNAVKLFVPLRKMTANDGVYPNSTTYNNTKTALDKAIVGLQKHNTEYSIKSGTLAETGDKYNVLGGWWHKEDYENQMWLDGAYMGPALFAQLVNYSGSIKNIDSSNDWNLIVKQFEILRSLCWNSTDELPYHAFAADGGTNTTSHSDTWAGLSSNSPYCFHSASYWGRAAGWYFLALVDILEEMDKAKIATNDEKYTKLKGYLTEIAQGLAKRQDQATGGWYQILDETDTYSASEYNNGQPHTKTCNYIESSATALFTAAYLKAIRLKYIDETETVTVNGTAKTYKDIAVNGYKCLVNNFFSLSSDGKVNIFGSCRSAGLGGKGSEYESGAKKFRDGSKPYYLLGSDVAMVKKSEKITEGKVLGAFILAATEYERQYQPSMLLSKDLNKKYSLGPNESLSAEVLGEGTATYQWYDATTLTAITGATNASYTPTQSGKYYCVITVTPTTAAKTRATSTEPYTITTSTADVTVAAAATTYTVTFNAGSNGTCSTTSIKQASANASINLPSVTANTGYTFDGWYTAQTGGTKIGGAGETYTPTDNITLYAHYTATGGSGTVIYKYTVKSSENTKEIAYTATGGTATLGASNKVDTNGFKSDGNIGTSKYIKVDLTGNTLQAGDVITIKAYSGNTGGGIYIATATAENSSYVDAGKLSAKNKEEELKYTVTETDVLKGLSTIYLFRNTGVSTYIRDITITRSGSSTEPTPSSNASATFTYNGSALSFTDNVATINLEVLQANSSITVNAAPATGATIATSSENTSIADNVITITTPAAGSSASYAYTVTAADGKTTQTYTINVSVSSASTGETNVYSYKVEESGLTAPGINTSKYITTNSDGETGDKLVKMTFGGWKWDGFASEEAKQEGTKTKGSYIIVRGKSTKYYTDSWKNSTGGTGTNIASIDNYQYWFEGTQDAVDESKALTGTIYGTPRYGWFVSPTRVDGKTTESHPFTLPVRGSFMTFEPTQNGTLSIYILQNGAWNTNKSGTYTDTDGEGTITYSNGQIVAGEFRPHAFHVVNQRGLTVQEFSPKYSVETRQTVNSQYYCMFEGEGDQTKYDSPYNVARWKEFKDYMSKDEQQRCHDNWNNGEGGAQTITELDNGSFLAIEKGIVKYTFHVTGNETYYFFSNFSKMGFSGANFVPDESQPEKTVSGKISTLELSDVTAYSNIEYTENGTIEGTNLYNYTYKIGGTEIAPVAGVSIPQFYSIKLTRTFKPNQWTTLTLPFNLTQDEVQRIFGDGTQIIMLDKATLSSDGGARLHFIYHEIQNVLPGYPYLIKPTLVDVDETNDAVADLDTDGNGNIISFTVYGKCINPFIKPFEVNTTPYTFKGTPGYCTPTYPNSSGTNVYSVKYKANDIFVSEGDGKLYVSGDSSYGKGYRAWLQKKETGNPTAVKSISVVMSSFSDDDDTTTSIDVAEMAPDLIEALGIQTGVYNLSGQRVANDTRNLKAGIYIVNGKKTVVR